MVAAVAAVMVKSDVETGGLPMMMVSHHAESAHETGLEFYQRLSER